MADTWKSDHQFGQSDTALKQSMSPKDWQQEYSQDEAHWTKDFTPSVFAKDFAKLLKEHDVKNILEVGCAYGRDSVYFDKRGFDVTGVDITPEAIMMARKIAKIKGADTRFKVANAENLPFPNSSFGAVFTISVLHSTDLTKSIPEIYRVLKNNGLCLIYIYSDTQFKTDKPDKAKIDTQEYLMQLINLGFEVLEVYQEDETKFDEAGEKHHKFVVTLQKVGK